MKKRLIFGLVSLGIFLGVAAAVVAAITVVHNDSKPKATTSHTGPQPGDPLSDTDTPKYDVCSLVSTDTIAKSFTLSNDQAKRSGEVAVNLEPAERCTYNVVNSGKQATLSISTYINSPKDNKLPDISWINVAKEDFTHQPYLPAYFKAAKDGDKTDFTLRILGYTHSYEFVIEQTTDAYAGPDAMKALLALADTADMK